jgi:nucleotide-binding universal stress UspA family protein
MWIGIKLLLPEAEEAHSSIEASDKLWSAVKTVIVADFVMSLDNVIAIAGAAEGAGGDHKMPLVIFGLLVSIPIIVWGSQLVIKLMDRYPVVITLGGMLLGWIAGQMTISDPVLKGWAEAQGDWLQYAAPVAGAGLVLLIGKWLAARAHAARPVEVSVAAEAGAAARLQRVLLAVDGSPSSAQAVRYLVDVRKDLRQPDALSIHLLNVQRPVSGDVSRFVAGQTLKDYHEEGARTALAPARVLLDAAGVVYQEHQRVGEPAQSIAEAAKEHGCDLVIMGTRGLGGHAAGLIGSVAQATVAQCSVPVLLVK